MNSNGEVVDSSEGMSELFNESFGKVFRLLYLPKAAEGYRRLTIRVKASQHITRKWQITQNSKKQ